MERELDAKPALASGHSLKKKPGSGPSRPSPRRNEVLAAGSEAVLALQRAAGNQAVSEALQRRRGGPSLSGVRGDAVIQRQWWRAFLRTNPAHHLARYEVLQHGTRYRADTRPPSEVRSSGFLPRVIRLPADRITQEDIAAYQVSAVNNPGIVSVAETLEGARTFARQLGTQSPGKKYIYRVDVSGLIHYPMAANISFWQRLFYSEQQENMIAGGIEPSRITLEEELETDGTEPPQSDFMD